MSYIAQAMASVGCGAVDTQEVATVCDTLTSDQKDIIDCWHNNGYNIPLNAKYQATADDLKAQYTSDDLQVMGAYINAKRNISEY